MALKATIYKAELQIADLDRNHYGTYNLTLARHPSETDERMMVRLLAFALHAEEGLACGKGLCVDDEPDLWLRDLTGDILCWIDVGQPDEKWVRKACGRARKVVVLSYGRAADIWWQGVRDKLARQERLTVLNIAPEAAPALAALTARGMRLQFTIQDGQVWVTDGERSVHIEPVALHGGV
ncbi:YaeQ family protein [Pseudothauera nasutitermitis]|uniref:YaeQ family protein n=1 Tax=Pseudothauera nasutitermitis TaxID=2565930 RepID=A0A4S4B1E0_9RHOO|nr:YaeQ family protein [Pseudothauera nasutitermitis]THF66316.1 YaeQ family protein [Pseudothauera nasutitermitis]